MLLALKVLLLVLGVTVLAGLGGYLVDRGEEREERKEWTKPK